VFNSWLNYNHELNTKSINVTQIICLTPTKLFLFTPIFLSQSNPEFWNETHFWSPDYCSIHSRFMDCYWDVQRPKPTL